MALPNPITASQTAAKSPIDQNLMDSIRLNLDYLDGQIGAGGGGGGGIDPKEIFAEAEVKTDEGIYWKRRFHPSQNTLTNGANQEGFDPEGKNRNDRFIFPDFQDLYSFANQGNGYNGSTLEISKGGKLQFKIKKGENFFSIGENIAVSLSDNIEIYIDGSLANNLQDENGNTTTGSYSSNSATVFYQKTNFFYGLDGEEHIVTILNNDSASKAQSIEFIEVGYRSHNPTISNELKLFSGKAVVKGSEVSYSEGTFSFSEPTEGNANGRTDALKIDTSGTVSVLEENHSPAMTQCKAEEAIAFSSAVTSLKVKNNWYFPNNGICLLSLPTGQHHLFSYSSKSQPSIANHTLDGIVWSSQPTEDFTPLDGFTGGTGAARGDVNINLWAKAPIEITATNNYVDFSITVNGTTTSHSAQIAEGFYAADLIPIETAFKNAMQAVKPINGEYFLKYNARLGLYQIGCSDPEVTQIDFLFSTGSNQANSVHTTLGFANADQTGATSYSSNTEVRHLARRVFQPSKEFDYADSPKFKYSWSGNTVSTPINDALERLGFPSYRGLRSGSGGLVQHFPSDDSTGASFSFLINETSAYITFQIDDGPCMYLIQPDKGADTNSPPRVNIQTCYVSFPKGSRKISFRYETSSVFQRDFNATMGVFFLGSREYFTKPSYEALTSSEQILHCIESAPISLYATNYGHNGGTLYSPDNGGISANDDQLNTISESGSWSGSTSTSLFNVGFRITNTTNDYLDVNFTVGNGGGIFIKTTLISSRSDKIAIFLSTTTINELTDRVSNVCNEYTTNYYDQNTIGIDGLPSGTYTARFKNEGSGSFVNSAIVIVDSEQPQKNAYVHADLNNTGQGLAYPVNVFRENLQQDSQPKTPDYLQRSGYKEGRVTSINYAINSLQQVQHDDTSNLFLGADVYFTYYFEKNVIGSEINFNEFCKTISIIGSNFNSFSGVMNFEIDGVNTANNFTTNNQVKGGSAPSATRRSITRNAQKLYELTCSFSAGSTYTIADTRGLRDGMRVRIFDGTNYEDFTIANIVTNTSFDINQTASVITPANAELVQFFGFHNININLTTSAFSAYSAIEYEPLPLFPSNFKKQMFRNKKLEYKTVNFKDVVNGDDLYYPFFSDGTQANWSNSSIDITAMNSTAMTYSFDSDLKNVTLSTSSIDVKITSSKEVYEDIDGMEKY